MLSKNEVLAQKRLEAKFHAENIAKKQRPLQNSGNVKSQWGQVVTNESRLIDNGHFMKTAEQGKRDFLRGEVKRLNKEKSKQTEIVLVKKV